ncbi:AIPR family protein [Candidatus Magnetominusculus dajiuhuensis]|uniref:AIPR family protein n=1 Tax=Candidatus Magnetominusculus dajiuhuensis TaxID=3137712 RepID=UPI003B43B6FB
MDIEDYRKDFIETVSLCAASERDLTQSAFVTIASQHLMDADEFPDFEPCYHEGIGIRDKRVKFRIDGYSLDDIDGSAKLLVADFRGGAETETLTRSDAETLFQRLQAFIAESLSGQLHPQLEQSSPAYALAEELYRRGQSITRFLLFLVTDAELSSRVIDWPDDSQNNIPVEYHIWDIVRFHRVHESELGREAIEIDFTEFQKEGIPCLVANIGSDQYMSYLCVVPGHVLADIYDKYGSRLLEQNVRSFLTLRGGINKGIRNTILNEPAMFFAYNVSV